MNLSNRSKILIFTVLVALVIYFFFWKGDSVQTQYSGESSNYPSGQYEDMTDVVDVRENNNSLLVDLQSNDSSNNTNDSSNSDADSLFQKFEKKVTTKNAATNGYKEVNYKNGARGQSTTSNLNKFFDSPYPNDASTAKGFVPVVEDDGKYASYMSDNNTKKMTEKDKFNPSSLLPKEKNKNWFDDPQEVAGVTNIKSSKLLNIHRPAAVNTIQSTLKNAAWDLRGTPNNPKYAISPFNNSSIEPDTNLNNQSLCY